MTRKQKRITITMQHYCGRQQGIQSDHAGTEYALKYYDTPEWQRWARRDKTIILLQAYTDTQLEEAYKALKKLKVPVTKFYEPDLTNSLTAICFLAVDAKTKLTPTDEAVNAIKNKFPMASS